jgi:hypothetical protein
MSAILAHDDGPELGLLDARQGFCERVARGAQLAERDSGGDSEELGGGEGGAEAERLGGAVDAAAQAQPNGWCDEVVDRHGLSRSWWGAGEGPGGCGEPVMGRRGTQAAG